MLRQILKSSSWWAEPTRQYFFCEEFYFQDFLHYRTERLHSKKNGIPHKCGATKVWNSTLFMDREVIVWS